MDKKMFIAGAALAVIVIVAAAALCFYLFGINGPQALPPQVPAAVSPHPGNVNQSGETATAEETAQPPATAEEELMEDITASVQTNPVEDKPDINPATQTNPIRKIKTNPFE